MPDRIVRDELLSSERWLELKGNDDRIAFLVLLLSADALGNIEAGEARLMRLWRDYGINTPAMVAKVLTELADCDLVRLYEVDGKRYLHIPRYRQEMRYLKRCHPLSPWTTDEQKQALARNSRRGHDVSTTSAQEKRSEEKRSEEKAAANAAPPARRKSQCPKDFAVSERVVRWAVENGHDRLDAHFAAFMSYVRRKAPSYADWDEALMTAIRENWAKLPAKAMPSTRVAL